MEQKSIWHQEARGKARPELSGEIYTDTVVIGGGMAGILTAHFLKQAGIDCIVLEEKRVGSGTTGNTTAKVTSQHGMIYEKLLNAVGEEKARQYAAANQTAIERYEILIEKYHCDCGFRRCPAYLYTNSNTGGMRREYDAAKKLGLPAELVDSAGRKKAVLPKCPEEGACAETEKTQILEPEGLPFSMRMALRFQNQAQFHPLKFLFCIAEELEIYEHTRVLTVEKNGSSAGNIVTTEHGIVHAAHVVFACHFPFVNVPGYYFLRMHQDRSYVMAVKNAEILDGMYYDIDGEVLSFRSAGAYLLVGGGGHRTGGKVMGDPYEYLWHVAETYWPECREAARWSAQDCMTLDGIPYIGMFSDACPDWYVATGFGKWGMTSSMVSAMILSDFICGRENPNAEVFSPQRFQFSSSVGNLMKESGIAVSGLTKRMMKIPKETLQSVSPGEGAVVEVDGEKYGVYKEPDGTAHVVSVKCPHLGCELSWNQTEKSWDCPCHGSRFDFRGRKLDGPAQEGIAF